jgi:hypothetical protein
MSGNMQVANYVAGRGWAPPARPSDTGRYKVKRAEGVGFEPTDSLLSSAFKALALGRYANPPERDGQAGALDVILAEPARATSGARRQGRRRRPGARGIETVGLAE